MNIKVVTRNSFVLCRTSENTTNDDNHDKEIENINNNNNEANKGFLRIKEIHPQLKREVTRHKFPGNTGWYDKNLCQ